MADTEGVNVGILQTEIEKSKEKLKNVEDNIRKLTGRDPNEFRPGVRPFRQQDNSRGRFPAFGRGARQYPGDGFLNRGEDFPNRPGLPRYQPQSKFDESGRLKRRDRDSDEDEPASKRGMQSSVVAKGAVTREQVLERQKSDSSGVARNRRMFGVLMGTLQKFGAEEKRKVDVEAKRKEVEKKLEDKARQEKEAVIKEKQDLKQQQRLARIKIRRLEQKMELAEIHSEWEKQTMHLMNFIRTQAKPHIFYLPKKLNSVSEKKLKESHQLLDGIIVERRKQLNEEIADLASEEGAVKEEAATAALKKQAQQATGAGDKGDELSDSDLEDTHATELVDDDMPQDDLHVGGNGSTRADEEPVIIRTLSGGNNNGVQSSAAAEVTTGNSNTKNKLVVVVDNTLDTDIIVSNKADEHSDEDSDSESQSSKQSSNSSDEDKMVVD